MPVTVTVETGDGVDGANAYQTVADWKEYADQQGWNYSAYSDELIGSGLIRGTAAVDAWEAWSGVRTYGRDQSLQWPRKAGSIQYGQYVADGDLLTVVDREGIAIEENEVPQALIDAAAQAAWREIQEPGAMSPDYGQRIAELQAGSVRLKFADGASARTQYDAIDNLLATLMPSGAGGDAAEIDLLRA